ncbi:MAG: circularly permuted type 2 ATP-grasp protein, partial [Bacillota bacterium]
MLSGSMALANYYNEMYAEDGAVRPHYAAFADWLRETSPSRIAQNRQAADLLFHRVGITFAVYGEASGTERLIPFDIVPHVIRGPDWDRLANGLRQRVEALNRFLHDIYHSQEILAAGKVPRDQVHDNPQFRREMVGVEVPGGIYAHIAGVDLVKAEDGDYYVLEDNLRTPSGVSYMLENRKMMMRLFPELFANQRIRPVDHYPDLLVQTLRGVAPLGVENPTIVLLTPGHYNSAYFEHAFLAQQMGIELVEGQDLFVANNTVFMRTTQGPQKVDVIYRRIDDDFLDPLAFRPDSMLGVPGLLSAYRAGRVTLANAIGTGVADDKSLYPYVPEMIRFYLGQEPILRNVPTYLLRKPEDRDYVLAHLDELVVKEAQGSGDYGMLVGPTATVEERERYRQRIVDS